MPLTNAQLTTLKAHLLANTNLVNGVAINAIPAGPDNDIAIANWYNATALAGDSQPFADSLTVWKPVVTITELNGAISWAQDPAGSTDAARTNSWLRWQSMCWSNAIDLTDAQVRSGVADVWGAGSSTNTAIKAVGVGRRAGTRFELLFAGQNRGPDGNAASGTMADNGRVSAVFGQKLTAADISAARNI